MLGISLLKQVLLKLNSDIEIFRALTPQYKTNQLTKYSVSSRIFSIWPNCYYLGD